MYCLSFSTFMQFLLSLDTHSPQEENFYASFISFGKKLNEHYHYFALCYTFRHFVFNLNTLIPIHLFFYTKMNAKSDRRKEGKKFNKGQYLSLLTLIVLFLVELQS